MAVDFMANLGFSGDEIQDAYGSFHTLMDVTTKDPRWPADPGESAKACKKLVTAKFRASDGTPVFVPHGLPKRNALHANNCHRALQLQREIGNRRQAPSPPHAPFAPGWEELGKPYRY